MVGSNIFNILAVLGVAAASAPNGIVVDAAAMQFDIPVMIAASVACLPIFYTRGCIDRWEGAFFLIGYIVYVSWLWLHASQAQARHAFGDAMIWFVLPLAALTLVASLLRNSRRRSRGSG